MDNILNTFKNGNAKTEIHEQGGSESLQGEQVVQGSTGSGLLSSVVGEPIYRKNYSHYNEATKNGNDRDYTTVARTDANWQQPSPAAQVVVPLNKPLTQTQKAILTKAFIDAGLGVTITDKEISTGNFSELTDDAFYHKVDGLINSFKDGNAKTTLQEQGGGESLQGKSMVQGEGGGGLSATLDLGEIIHRKNYSHYNEATKNGNDRDYTTVARTDANWQHTGDQFIYEQEEGSSSLRVPQTAISREDLLQRLQNVYTQTEEAMPSPVPLVPKNDGPDTPLGGGEGGNPIVRDSEGNVRCTDPIIRWEQGERYRLQTEEEVEQDEANEKKMDALFDDEEIEAQIESVYQNHF